MPNPKTGNPPAGVRARLTVAEEEKRFWENLSKSATKTKDKSLAKKITGHEEKQ